MTHQVWVVECKTPRMKHWRIYIPVESRRDAVEQMKCHEILLADYQWRIRKYVPGDRDD